PGEPARYEASVFEDLQAPAPSTIMGVAQGQLVPDLAKYRRFAFADGTCPLTWRQGSQHDAAPVMEPSPAETGARNKLGEEVDVEAEYVYPLLKSSDVVNLKHPEHRLWVIVPQKRLGENTRELEYTAPRLWRYLTSHADVFAIRMFTFYKHQPTIDFRAI